MMTYQIIIPMWLRLNIVYYWNESRVWETLTLTKFWYQIIDMKERERERDTKTCHTNENLNFTHSASKQVSKNKYQKKTKWYRQSPLQTSAIQQNESFNVWLELSIKLLCGETTSLCCCFCCCFSWIFTTTIPSISNRSTIDIRDTDRERGR